jgi:hypothetical protein
MKSESSYSPAEIQAEHERLGHKLGWRLFTCPAQNIETASVALITINPGGSKFEEPRWSVEAGSAYAIESWKDRPPGQESLQRQVRRMFEIMAVKSEEVLSGYLVPFRSSTWNALENKQASKEFGLSIWRDILDRPKPRTVIAFGKDIADDIASLLDAKGCKKYSAGWGEQTIDTFHHGSGGKLIVLPHLSRFSLFNRPQSEEAFLKAALGSFG